MSNQAHHANNIKKVAIVYYSHSGNTGKLANQINNTVGGIMIEIQPVELYPDDYDALTKQAKRELQAGYRPPLKPSTEDISDFDLILVGSPNWWNTVAPPVITFLSACDLSGKKIAPFITHEGSCMGRSAADIARLCPGANVLDGLAVRGGRVNAVQGELTEWLRKLGIA